MGGLGLVLQRSRAECKEGERERERERHKINIESESERQIHRQTNIQIESIEDPPCSFQMPKLVGLSSQTAACPRPPHRPGGVVCIVACSEVQWSGMEWCADGVQCSGVEWSAMEWSGVRTGVE